jgi:hypothetical protein
MAVSGISGPSQTSRVEAGPAMEAAAAAEARVQAPQVSRIPLTARPDPTRLASQGAQLAPPLSGAPADFLTTKAERDVYAFLAHGDHAIDALLDRLDTLSPASYNRVLHALALTRSKGAGDAKAPTLLDVLVGRGSNEPGKARLAQRFFTQLERKLAGQPGRILSHLSPSTRARLEAQPGWGRIASLLSAH